MRYATLQPPRHCFCQVTCSGLQHWLDRCAAQGLSALELLALTTDPEERELIGLVALLDADEHGLMEAMSQVSLPYTHILHCRNHTRALLKLPPLNAGS